MSTNAKGSPALVHRQTGQPYPLSRTVTTIGRQADNTITLPDPQVSRHHARVSWQAGGFVIEDLGSANGTYVNEQLVTGPRLLRHGYVVHMGNTVLDVFIPSIEQDEEIAAPGGAPIPMYPRAAEPRQRLALPIVLGLVAGGLLIVCIVAAVVFWLLDLRGTEPTVTMQSPLGNAVVMAGNEILLQASATGARDITRLELMADGLLVASGTSEDAGGQPSLTASGTWTFFEAGSHIISAVAYTARDRSSGSTSMTITVTGAASTASPAPPGETPAIPPTTASPVTTTPGAATDVATDAPSPPATDTAAPTPTVPPPEIEFFRANPDAITLGTCAELEWGVVTDATEATIEPGIGGIATPGSQEVCPTETTTYVLTGSGTGGISTATVTVTVSIPDLRVEAVSFIPDPPTRGQVNQVQITIQNQGTGNAGAFAWAFLPGAEQPLTGNVPQGLAAGLSTTVTAEWQPVASYPDLVGIARVDTGNTVAESDEGNNDLQVSTAVMEPAEPATVMLLSSPDLDGPVLSGGSVESRQDLRIGNFGTPADEQVYRSLLSFDPSTLPLGATIQSAELRLYQDQIIGDPYGHLGLFLLEHVDYGPSLDAGDYHLSPSGQLSVPTVTTPGSWYSIGNGTLTTWLATDVGAGFDRMQFRLLFSIELDANSEADYVRFESGDGTLGTGNLPELVITYTP